MGSIEELQREINSAKEEQSMLYFQVEFIKLLVKKDTQLISKKEIYDMIDIAERNALSELQIFKSQNPTHEY